MNIYMINQEAINFLIKTFQTVFEGPLMRKMIRLSLYYVPKQMILYNIFDAPTATRQLATYFWKLPLKSKRISFISCTFVILNTRPV